MLNTTLPVECRCVPRNPFYLCWLNRHGGYDYWMFQKRQSLEHSQEDVQAFTPFIPDYATATKTDVLVSKTVEERITIGAQQLHPSEWKALSHIAKSAIVQHYDKDNERWVDVLVDKSKIVMQTDNGLHGIELTLLLPTPQLAI